MSLRIASWNINSIRMRIDLLRRLAETAAPDIICLQETKVADDQFPHIEVAAIGYPYRQVHGMKAYNGVAILSKEPFEPLAPRKWCGRDDSRHAAIRLLNGVEIHDIYIPSGGDVPDPAVNEKFAHKLSFLDELAAWGQDLPRNGAGRVIVGDFNVAPLESDVWSHKQLLKVVSHTPVEVEKLDRVQDAHGWVDGVRRFVPADQKLYSWWSYRAKDWRKSNRGRRLDHIWVSPPLERALCRAEILRDARDWPKASDHVPVVVELEV